MTGELRFFRRRRLSIEEGEFAARTVLAMPIAARAEKLADLYLDDPETLLPLMRTLTDRLEESPETVLAETEFLYGYLVKLEPQYPADVMYLEEQRYFLGEAARLAAVACRHLSRRDEARQWLERAAIGLRHTVNAGENWAKLSYQHLALCIEERCFDEVLEFAVPLVDSFEKFGMAEDALKSRFLQAVALKETGEFKEAQALFRDLRDKAEALGKEKLLGSAYVNLLHLHAFLGEGEEALAEVAKATPILRQLNNRIDLGKLQWGIATMLRARGQLRDAVEAYRAAQKEFAEIGMRADVAAIQLVVADLLLDVGQHALRQSLQNHRINQKALRELHGGDLGSVMGSGIILRFPAAGIVDADVGDRRPDSARSGLGLAPPDVRRKGF